MSIDPKGPVDKVPDDATPIAMLTVGQLRAVIAAATTPLPDDDQILTVEQIHERYKMGREALRAAAGRGELQLMRGGHGRIMCRRSAIEAWLESRPVSARLRKAPADDDFDELDEMVKSGELAVRR